MSSKRVERIRRWRGSLAGRVRRRDGNHTRERGQVLPIFAVMAVVVLGGAALVTDAAWWWTVEQRMQRAADAGALAGAIHLPQDETRAIAVARAETAKNGFTHGLDGITVSAEQDDLNDRKLIVDINGATETSFARVFGLTSIDVAVTGSAEFVLPVPMGSPESYYGVFGPLRRPGGGGGPSATALPSSALAGDWNPSDRATLLANVLADDTTNAWTTSDGAVQPFGGFGLLGSIPDPGVGQTLTIDGIQILLNDTAVTRSCSNSFVEAHLSWDGGSSWSSAPSPNSLNDTRLLDTNLRDVTIGSSSSTAAFPHAWVRDDFDDGRFQLRLRARKGCSRSSTRIRVDQVRVRVTYTLTGASNTITGPDGSSLNAQGFWGTMLSQGADDVNGDAFLPAFDQRSRNRDNPDYRPDSFYNYGIEFPPGTSNGEVWIFDPGFCATSGGAEYGTGDRWFGSGAISAFYNLYDTANTPYADGDDVRIETSGTMFRRSVGTDTTLGGPSASNGRVSCADGDVAAPTVGQLAATPQEGSQYYYHNRWWRIASGLEGGKTYRLETGTTDPVAPSDQRSSNGQNSFAIWSKATYGSPRIYGLGTMQNFSPLPGGGASVFYLSQIGAENRGRIMEIRLWDPGDTNTLSADLEILEPTAAGYRAVTLDWTSERGTTNSNAANCDSLGDDDVTSIETNVGGGSRGVFNGCWVKIDIPLSPEYDAPTPPGESEGGWWKIKYTMGGNAADNSFDLTTWQVSLRGNPVHLVQQ